MPKGTPAPIVSRLQAASAAAGGTSVLMDQSYAQGVAEWIEREQVNVWNGPPELLHSLALLCATSPLRQVQGVALHAVDFVRAPQVVAGRTRILPEVHATVIAGHLGQRAAGDDRASQARRGAVGPHGAGSA